MKKMDPLVRVTLTEQIASGNRIVQGYAHLTGQLAIAAEEPATMYVDVLTDLMHAANDREISFDNALAIARNHFDEELADAVNLAKTQREGEANTASESND